jgi:2-polyprenyl-3-methyl-5-hydroxy-6-metoxy-1,4-benzoquinol methylase
MDDFINNTREWTVPWGITDDPWRSNEFFQYTQSQLPRFWEKLGGKPDFSGKKVLEVGCGLGNLCIDIAKCDAQEIIGIDIDQKSVEFASGNLAKKHKALTGKIKFLCCDIHDLPIDNFDIIISKDTFEHILDLEGVLFDIRERMNLQGRIHTAFGPLYYSPFGDHNWTETFLPWGHILIPEEKIVKRLNKKHNSQITSIRELGDGLNQLTPEEFSRILRLTNLRIVDYKENVIPQDASFKKKIATKIMGQLKHINQLSKYLTFNISCILEKNQAG